MMDSTLGGQRGVGVYALLTDGLGGHGGIAEYNRGLIAALAASSRVESVTVAPRFAHADIVDVPAKVVEHEARPARTAYVVGSLRVIRRTRPIDVVFCGHINMLPLAAVMARHCRAKLWLQVHGIDAWTPQGRLVRRAVKRADLVTAVSRHTRRRFLQWASITDEKVRVLPNTFDPRFARGVKPEALAQSYGVAGRKVLLTVSRLAAAERYKGHDRVIAALPRIRLRHPDTAYLIVGDGDDRARLEGLARDKGVAEHVIFAGRVDQARLADHYRLADVFVMPSTGEGFGIVFLEAVALGVPAIAGDRDGSRDALADGELGTLVDPDDIEAIADAVGRCLEGRTALPVAPARFGRAGFFNHVDILLRSLAA